MLDSRFIKGGSYGNERTREDLPMLWEDCLQQRWTPYPYAMHPQALGEAFQGDQRGAMSGIQRR